MMEENTTTSTASNGFWHPNSPLPYLFAGLALLLGLIAVALIMLACAPELPASAAPSDSSGAHDHDEEKLPRPVYADPETAPRIVVMAGDDTPKYLAKPTASASTSCADQQV